ncbi:hypothetical protein ACSSZE_03520 [Acidithiobacillus caldus]
MKSVDDMSDEEILAMDPKELAKTHPQLAELVEIKQNMKYINDFDQRLTDAVEFTASLPGWIRSVFDLSGDSPEYVLSMLRDTLQKLPPDAANNEDVLAFLMTVAIHRVHRFGAGPAPRADYLDRVQGKVFDWLQRGATEAQRSKLEDRLMAIFDTTPLEPSYWQFGPKRMEWPLIFAEPELYEGGGRVVS